MIDRIPEKFPMGLATRDAYGKALAELGRENPAVVVLDADLSKSTKTETFGKEFPDRFFNMGIQEAHLVSAASGMALAGKTPFISSFACFLVCKGYDQLRMSVAYPRVPVKVVTSHGGISIGEDGPSQQSIEDVALMATLPGFAVMVPSDEVETRALVRAAAARPGPVYIRTGRPKAPRIYADGEQFEIGRAKLLLDGPDVTIVANGLLVAEALYAARELAGRGIRATVLDMHTVKPLDENALVAAAARTGAVVTAEEHSIYGGLGACVSQALGRLRPVPVESVAIADTYAESATPDELMAKYGLTAREVVRAVERVLARKGR